MDDILDVEYLSFNTANGDKFLQLKEPIKSIIVDRKHNEIRIFKVIN